MFGDSVVWFAEAGVPDDAPTSPPYWRSLTSWAVIEATSGRGPVHVNVALRDPLYADASTAVYPLSTEGREDGRPWTEAVGDDPAASEASIDALKVLIRTTERGVVVVGATSEDLSSLPALAEAPA